MGGSDTAVVKRAINDAKDIPNIYFDTSGITTPYAVEYAVRVIDVRRILFGSDEPWCSFRSMYYNVVDAEIPEEYKERILSENFKDLVIKSEVVRELLAN
jgi:predicted TIM-barrel fold metal-dependent hydrolase